jgi:Prophage minor tail protein Z (GPZ)
MKIAIDTSGLEAYVAKANKVDENVIQPTLAVSLNTVGDGLLSLMATNFSKETGLAVEQVRGLMRVKRATKNDLSYDVIVDNSLLEDDPRTLEGRRESRDFGKQRPDTLVIIVNQKDDLVCPDCEELAAAGPMPIEVAKQHVPKHPHCRCLIMPYVQKGKRLPVTMTTMTGRSPTRRSGQRQDREMTLRQMAQEILDKTVTKIKIELK